MFSRLAGLTGRRGRGEISFVREGTDCRAKEVDHPIGEIHPPARHEVLMDLIGGGVKRCEDYGEDDGLCGEGEILRTA